MQPAIANSPDVTDQKFKWNPQREQATMRLLWPPCAILGNLFLNHPVYEYMEYQLLRRLECAPLLVYTMPCQPATLL